MCGFNFGYVKGILEVMECVIEDLVIDVKKIYVFDYFLVDLKLVVGIVMVLEGNMVLYV